jgi:hypothetical protein
MLLFHFRNLATRIALEHIFLNRGKRTAKPLSSIVNFKKFGLFGRSSSFSSLLFKIVVKHFCVS